MKSTAVKVRKVTVPLVTLVVLMVIAGQRLIAYSSVQPAQSDNLLAQVMQSLPLSVGPWVGQPHTPMSPAVTPLRQVEVVCRRYQNVTTGQDATLLLVWAEDRRDLIGYDVPKWYAGQGWVVRQTAQRAWRVSEQMIPAVTYEVAPAAGDSQMPVQITSFLVLPDGKLAQGLREVEYLPEDTVIARSHGAVLVHLQVPGDTSRLQRRNVMQTLLADTMTTITRAGD